jgi:hypothetical protein
MVKDMNQDKNDAVIVIYLFKLRRLGVHAVE